MRVLPIAVIALLCLSAAAQKPSLPTQRAKIKDTLFVPDPLPALKPESYGQFQPEPGIVAERVSYSTAYGLRVPAIVYRPAVVPAGKMPGIVVVNGHGGDKYTWYAFYAGILYARAGAVVLTYDPIGEGERNCAAQIRNPRPRQIRSARRKRPLDGRPHDDRHPAGRQLPHPAPRRRPPSHRR